MSGSTTVPTATLHTPPLIGATAPGFVVRATFAIVAGGLAVLQLGVGFWFMVAVVLIIAAVVRPALLTGWLALILIGVSLLWNPAPPGDWRPFALLAGVHLAHLLASWMLPLPPRARVQLRVFARPFARFALIQALAQLVSVVVLLVLPALTGSALGGSGGAGLPLAGVIAALALGTLALVLVVPLLHRVPS